MSQVIRQILEPAKIEIRAGEVGEVAASVVVASGAEAVAQVAEVQVGAGNRTDSVSPIVEAILRAEAITTAEIRVHVSEAYFERDALARARKIFFQLGMNRTENRNAVLLYVNLRRRKYAIFGDEGIHSRLGHPVWSKILRTLHDDLLGTHPERAIAQCVELIGVVLGQIFPHQPGQENHDELPNQVSRD